jgi:hypothetical protein
LEKGTRPKNESRKINVGNTKNAPLKRGKGSVEIINERRWEGDKGENKRKKGN